MLPWCWKASQPEGRRAIEDCKLTPVEMFGCLLKHDFIVKRSYRQQPNGRSRHQGRTAARWESNSAARPLGAELFSSEAFLSGAPSYT
jgi:hypothetical protein